MMTESLGTVWLRMVTELPVVQALMKKLTVKLMLHQYKLTIENGKSLFWYFTSNAVLFFIVYTLQVVRHLLHTQIPSFHILDLSLLT